jgi:HD domain
VGIVRIIFGQEAEGFRRHRHEKGQDAIRQKRPATKELCGTGALACAVRLPFSVELMPEYKPLPSEVQELCRAVGAPPRLVAHLVLVHDCACRIMIQINKIFPEVQIEEERVLFGAATHDIGKAIHNEELSVPGHKHESEGRELLKKLGIADHFARFAWTHGNWQTDADLPLEDLLVVLADNCWKGRRVPELETRIVQKISEASSKHEWKVFADLDEILQQVALEADERLAWQRAFPVSEEP